jgi:beta-phosphoglucomutase
MQKMKFDGAIFDVDGVLVDSPHERAWRGALARLMAGPWRDITPQTSYTPERYTTEVYQTYVAGKPREAGAQAALHYFGIADPDGRRVHEYADIKQAELLRLVEQGEFMAFDDALRFLLDLKAAGVKVAAASSSKNANLLLSKVPLDRFAGQYRFLKRNSTLLEQFDVNVCGRDFAQGKPAPDIFLAAAADLRFPAAHCIVIEDATSGVQAAKAGGMACIGVARLGDAALLRAAGADWVVTSLDELPAAALLEIRD